MERIVNSVPNVAPLLSITMLVKDAERWDRFVVARVQEMEQLKRLCPFAFEAVFILNGSVPPNLREQLQRISFPATAVLHEENHIVRARNIATHVARGEYLFVWDDDDALRTPEAFPAFVQTYDTLPVGVLCAELLRQDGTRLHPQTQELMPQRIHPEIPTLLLTGMQHTPFIVRRSIVEALPLSEVRQLRGEWIDWSTRLWRAGIPIGYLRPSLCVFQDENSGASATRNESAFLHALVSLLSLAFEYGIEDRSYASDILYRRFAAGAFRERFADPEGVWGDLLKAGRTLISCNGFGAASGEAFAVTREAFFTVQRQRTMLEAGRSRIAAETVYDAAPFELFEASREPVLLDCLAGALERLETYKGSGT